MLVISIILFGYNVSDLFLNYESSCEKIDEFKEMARVRNTSISSLRLSSFFMSFVFFSVYAVMTRLSGFAFWITAVVSLKFLITLFGSDQELVRVMKTATYPKKFYYLSKVDAFFNALLGLCIALFLVL